MNDEIDFLVLNQFKCCLVEEFDHFVTEPYTLPCGGNACKRCINTHSSYSDAVCKSCFKSHSKDELRQSIPCADAEFLMKNFYLKDISKMIADKIKFIIDLEDHGLDNIINEKFKTIEIDIDLKIESLIKDLDIFRIQIKDELYKTQENIKKCLSRHKLDKMMKNFKEMQNVDTTKNYDLFEEHNKALFEYEKEKQLFMCLLKKYKFIPSENIKKNFIGNFSLPLNYEMKNKVQQVIFNAKDLWRGLYVEHENKLILTDLASNSLKILDKNGDLIEVVKKDFIKDPYIICSNICNEIFIYCSSDAKINVLNDKFDLIRQFNTCEVSGAHYMTIDWFDENQLLYMSHSDDDKISIWESNTGKFVKTFQATAPTYIACCKENVYVISETKYESKNSLVPISNSENCIFVIDKLSCVFKKKIKYPDWLCQRGLFIDNFLNIITVARERTLAKNQTDKNNYHLYIIDQNDKIMLKKNVDGISSGRYVIINSNRLFQIGQNKVEILEFQH